MFKKTILAILPLALLAVNVRADDNELSIDVDSISVADANIVDDNFDVDVDALNEQAGAEESADAIEACFRRFGYGYRSGWNRCYRSYRCYRPFYRYSSRYCVRPIYRAAYVVAPIYNHYWGCY